MTVAPGTPDPDLSRTLPEKLPVAWPCMAGEIISARTQTTTRSSILWDFVSAEPSTDLGHFVPTIVHFIVKPLSTKSARVALASTALQWIIRLYELAARKSTQASIARGPPRIAVPVSELDSQTDKKPSTGCREKQFPDT